MNKKLLAVVVAALAAGMSLGACSDDDKPGTAASSSTTTSGSTSTSALTVPPADAELTEFQAEKTGFALSYPKAWTTYTTADAQILLVASERPPAENRGGSVLVRAVSIGAKVTKANLEEAKQITDGIVTANKDVEITIPATESDLGGLPGWAYVYTFTDSASGQKGVHSHYFLFKDDLMLSFVFQAVPVDDFTRLSALFDRLAQTFRVL